MCQSAVSTTESGGNIRWESSERRGADSTLILRFYDLLNILDRFKAEPNYSPSCVCESGVLTGMIMANKAVRQSQGEGMRGLSEALKEKERGKISLHTKAKKQFHTEEKPCPAVDFFFRCSSGVCPQCPPRHLTKDPTFPPDNKKISL